MHQLKYFSEIVFIWNWSSATFIIQLSYFIIIYIF